MLMLTVRCATRYWPKVREGDRKRQRNAGVSTVRAARHCQLFPQKFTWRGHSCPVLPMNVHWEFGIPVCPMVHKGIPWDCTTFPSHLSIPSHCTMGQGDPMYRGTRGSHGIVPQSHPTCPSDSSIPSHSTMGQGDPMGLYHLPIPPVHPVPLYHETRGSHGIVPPSHPTCPSSPTVPWDKGIPWDCTTVPWLVQPSHLSIPSHCTMGQGDPMGLYQCPMAGAAIPPVHPVPLYHGTRGSHGTVPMSHGWCSHPTCPSRPTVPWDKGIPWDCTNVPWLVHGNAFK